MTNGGRVDASTFGQGNAGSVEITASDTITIDGEDSEGIPSFAASQVNQEAVGNAGGVIITTSNLTVTNGGQVSASTGGQGNADLVEITASDTITFDGEGSQGIPSGARSTVGLGAEGDAGGVIITTSNLTVTNGGQVSASTGGQGNAGNVTVNAREFIAINGVTENNRSGLFADALISSGNGGSVNVFTDRLTIDNGGTVEASNFDSFGENEPGTGEPGNINIEANSLRLSNQARIDAATQSETGNSANINLQVADSITLDGNSFISAQAFNNANGGNLTIDTNFIIAFPNGNNDIIANAQLGNGGNITINAESLFGIRERPLNDETNDINASSEFSLDGNVTINTPDLNPVQGATELPTNVVEPEQTTAQACQTDRLSGISSGLTIEGKGGIPPEPGLPLDSHNIFVSGQTNPQSTIPAPIETAQGKIQPARGVKVTESGEIILTAYRTNNSGDRLPETRKCQ